MQNLALDSGLKCVKFEIFGAVQGVGFRPFVYKICKNLALNGEVYNDSEGVKITLLGTQSQIEEFRHRLFSELPLLARIDRFTQKDVDFIKFEDFTIIQSKHTSKFAPILPDFAICDECKSEFYDKNNQRYHYAFINCTNCGPRLSIIKELPYDRTNTTMNEFEMCEFCHEQYINPLDRRYHAEPVSCPDCGPKLYLKDMDGKIIASGNESVSTLAEFIKEGKIVAVKGMGGFHIMCDAQNERVINELRDKKKRATKPFAIMCKDEAMAQNIAYINDDEKALLNSNVKPIVILKKRENSKIPQNLAPNLNKIGIFLPNTGLHLLIFEHLDSPIIATSANLSGEPIIYDDQNLRKTLRNVVQFYLDNNREIVTPNDDSIAFVLHQKNFYLRTSRGQNPAIFLSNFNTKGTFLALGAELKNQFAIYKDGQIFISPYIGDLKNVATFERFRGLLDIFIRTYDLKFDAIIGDLHPDFIHTSYFIKQGFGAVRLQHHYAHLLCAMQENSLLNSDKKYLGFCFDGTGHGTDGMIWGGEVMIFDEFDFDRIFHFDDFKLISGENSIKNIYKLAISAIYKYNIAEQAKDFLYKFDKLELKNLKKLCHSEKIISTTSLGRIFDLFAAVICKIDNVSFDGEAGMRLEALYIDGCDKFYEFEICDGKISFKNALLGALQDKPEIAATKFINGVCEIMVKIAQNSALDVVLSGGVFQNSTLLDRLINKFVEFNIKFYVNSKNPTNDSGIALGQLVYYLSKKMV